MIVDRSRELDKFEESTTKVGISPIFTRGKGQALFYLRPSQEYQHFDDNLISAQPDDTRLVIATARSQDFNSLSQSLSSCLEQLAIRQASFVAFGASCALIQRLALSAPKMVRRIVFVEPCTREQPSRGDLLIDAMERYLPLGLPLRLRGTSFDSRSLLQRIRCPVVVVVRASSSQFVRSQAHFIAQSIPTSWSIELSERSEANELGDLVRDFYLIPSRAPRKNLVNAYTIKL